jgi:hypothetical protein
MYICIHLHLFVHLSYHVYELTGCGRPTTSQRYRGYDSRYYLLVGHGTIDRTAL